jgi:hypothetical protein
MRELRPVYQALIIVDSLLILVLVGAVFWQPRLQALLPLAGVLAGVNAMLHSRTLEGLRPSLKRWLLLGGLAAVLFMGLVAVLRFARPA